MGSVTPPLRHRIFQSSPKDTKNPVETSVYGVFCFQKQSKGICLKPTEIIVAVLCQE
jgi:hypothetical protein